MLIPHRRDERDRLFTLVSDSLRLAAAFTSAILRPVDDRRAKQMIQYCPTIEDFYRGAAGSPV
jgi:hypothetical protein